MKNVSASSAFVVLFVFFAAALVFSSVVVIGPDERGVKVTLGKVDSGVLNPGVNFKTPFISKIETFKVSTNKAGWKFDTFSSDLQSVEMDIDIIWKFNPSKIDLLVTTYKNSPLETIIQPTMSECIKQICKSMTAEQIVKMRDKIRSEVKDMFLSRVNPYEIFIVEDVIINNMELSKELNRAIEQKMVQDQEAQKAEFIKKQKTVEAETARVQAEGLAKAEIEKASGQAKAIELEAQAKAKAILMIAEAEAKAFEQKGEALKRFPEAIRDLTIRSWDGKLPVFLNSAPASDSPFTIMLDGRALDSSAARAAPASGK